MWNRIFSRSLGKGLAQSAAALSESINRVLMSMRFRAQTIAQATLLRRPDSDTLGAYLRSLKGILPDYMNVHIADAGGRYRCSYRDNAIWR